ncbi:MAG: universal stress protein [Caldilineaceae bacterium]|nr:universal stress protein [Caldilineaceae bacterium]
MSVPYQRILVPLDGSEVAQIALPHAEDLAMRTGATLVLMQVVPPSSDHMLMAPGTTVAVTVPKDEHMARLVEEAHARLAEQVSRLGHLHIKAETMVDIGSPAGKLVDYAAAHAIDLIVMCTHGYSGLSRWQHGSVTTKVLAAASCPVLVIRPEG